MARVVVIGAGLVGACCAYRLAGDGHDVTVVDRGPIAGGATAASGSSVLLQTKSTALLLALARHSQTLYEELERDVGVTYRADGGVVLARTAEEAHFLRGRADWLGANGVAVEWFDAGAVRARIPDAAADLAGGTYAPGDAEVDPVAAARAIAAAAVGRGAAFRLHAPVRGLAMRDGTIRGVQLADGDLPADEVVVAAGPWSEQAARWLSIPLPLAPQKGEILWSAPLPPRLRGRILSAGYLMSKFGGGADDFSVGLAAGQDPDGRIKIGSTRERAGFDTTLTSRARDALRAEARAFLPGLRDVPFETQTAGLRPYCTLKRPIVGRPPGIAGVVLACGHGGDGVALSPVTAWIVGEIVAGRRTAYDDALSVPPSEDPAVATSEERERS